jgi:hypothetical protein
MENENAGTQIMAELQRAIEYVDDVNNTDKIIRGFSYSMFRSLKGMVKQLVLEILTESIPIEHDGSLTYDQALSENKRLRGRVNFLSEWIQKAQKAIKSMPIPNLLHGDWRE